MTLPTGRCEVILYSPHHDLSLADCDLDHIEGIINVWQDRSQELGQHPDIAQVFEFENKGEEIGVTLHHPHGQLYAFHHIPTFLQKEQMVAREFYNTHGRCLICDIIQNEIEDGRRIISENETMVAYVPEAARYAYEVHVSCKNHRPLIEQLTDEEVKDLALILKRVLYKLNNLFDFEMPYIMCHHQASSKQADDPSYHWHIEFYPPYRSANKLKYLAGCESGTGFFITNALPEDKAAELQAIACPF